MIKVALVGIGKIAVDQHVPALAASEDWSLAATVSRQGRVDGVPAYSDMAQMLAENPDIGMVSLCLPPAPRYEYARLALAAGRHVMLEKPPGATLAEVHALEQLAVQNGVSLFATWHSRMAEGVAAAKHWLADKTVTAGHITWREDVRRWHPGQDWIFEPAGMGVFDPGINALSILTDILPEPVFVRAADLEVPSNCQTPIGAKLTFSGNVTADFDWRQEGPQTWDIRIDTTEGELLLSNGGNTLAIASETVEGRTDIMGEYPALYARMAELVKSGQSDVDLAPMIHVSDAMTLGRRTLVDPFHF